MGASYTIPTWFSAGKKMLTHSHTLAPLTNDNVILQNEKTLQRVVSIGHVSRLVAHPRDFKSLMFIYSACTLCKGYLYYIR